MDPRRPTEAVARSATAAPEPPLQPRIRARPTDRERDYQSTPCRDACPVGTDARGYVQALVRGDHDTAYAIARAPNPLASVCAYICGAPCERACRRRHLDSAVAIRALKRAALEGSSVAATLDRSTLLGLRRGPAIRDRLARAGAFRAERGEPTGRVAIVGSGPAGLACAHDLALLGAEVTVFEAEDRPAGMLTQGIPEYRLPRSIVEREVDFIEQLGVRFRVATEVGADVAFADLVADHDAVLLAAGARRSRILDIPGADGDGVLGGLELLRAVNLERPVELRGSIVVVGGGNVALDVARSVLRRFRYDVSRLAAGQERVTRVQLMCLESRDEMPASEVEVIEGAEEGIELHTGLGPGAILRDEDGAVTGIRCRVVDRVFDDDGRFAPSFTDETVDLEADMIIFAVGQVFDLGFARDLDGLELKDNGAPSIVEGNRTTHPKIWVAGDLAHGPRLAIDAIASGRRAAISIHHHLTGEDVAPTGAVHLTRLEGFWRELDFEGRPRGRLPVLEPSERVTEQGLLVEQSVSPEWARREAGRCLDCAVHTIFAPHRCVLCGGCVEICPMSCFRLVPLGALELGGASPLEAGSNSGASALLKNDDTCIRCGLCASRCPTEALTMQRAELR